MAQLRNSDSFKVPWLSLGFKVKILFFLMFFGSLVSSHLILSFVSSGRFAFAAVDKILRVQYCDNSAIYLGLLRLFVRDAANGGAYRCYSTVQQAAGTSNVMGREERRGVVT